MGDREKKLKGIIESDGCDMVKKQNLDKEECLVVKRRVLEDNSF